MEEAGKEPADVDSLPNDGALPVDTEFPLVTTVTAVYNVAEYLDETIGSIVAQTYRPIEIGCYDDGSTDNCLQILQSWKQRVDQMPGLSMYIIHSPTSHGGPSHPRNQIIDAARGEYYCILDADDSMAPERVEKQLEVARQNRNALVGSDIYRSPADSTPYYVQWVCGMDDAAIHHQRYRECTIICPTWFMHRSVFERAGNFLEEPMDGQPPPEDLIFFHEHLHKGGTLLKVPYPLVCYRYRPTSMSSIMSKRLLQKIRISYLAKQVLATWPSFMIWGAGKDGRWFLNNIPAEFENAVTGFCDIDASKIGVDYYCQRSRRKVPVVHFREAKPPLIICVASKRTDGELEQNIASLGLVEGRDYLHFM